MQPKSFAEWVTATKEKQVKKAQRYAMQESAYQSCSYYGKAY
jgi:hypothetical protein